MVRFRELMSRAEGGGRVIQPVSYRAETTGGWRSFTGGWMRAGAGSDSIDTGVTGCSVMGVGGGWSECEVPERCG